MDKHTRCTSESSSLQHNWYVTKKSIQISYREENVRDTEDLLNMIITLQALLFSSSNCA